MLAEAQVRDQHNITVYTSFNFFTPVDWQMIVRSLALQPHLPFFHPSSKLYAMGNISNLSKPNREKDGVLRVSVSQGRRSSHLSLGFACLDRLCKGPLARTHRVQGLPIPEPGLEKSGPSCIIYIQADPWLGLRELLSCLWMASRWMALRELPDESAHTCTPGGWLLPWVILFCQVAMSRL